MERVPSGRVRSMSQVTLAAPAASRLGLAKKMSTNTCSPCDTLSTVWNVGATSAGVAHFSRQSASDVTMMWPPKPSSDWTDPVSGRASPSAFRQVTEGWAQAASHASSSNAKRALMSRRAQQ